MSWSSTCGRTCFSHTKSPRPFLFAQELGLMDAHRSQLWIISLGWAPVTAVANCKCPFDRCPPCSSGLSHQPGHAPKVWASSSVSKRKRSCRIEGDGALLGRDWPAASGRRMPFAAVSTRLAPLTCAACADAGRMVRCGELLRDIFSGINGKQALHLDVNSAMMTRRRPCPT